MRTSYRRQKLEDTARSGANREFCPLCRVRRALRRVPFCCISGMSPLRERGGDYRLRFGLHSAQMLSAPVALGVDLVDVFGARRPRGKPTTLGDHLEPADRSAVARRL